MRFNLRRMIFRLAEKTHFFSACRLRAVLMLGRNMPENEAWTSFSGSFLRCLKCFRSQKTDVKMACKSALRFLALRPFALRLAFRRCRMQPEGLMGCQIAFSQPCENPVFP
jgi:hypothetical protein